ncbi:MAG TPA: FAD-linked oxidase C-terminal domain-containing protein, partial [Rhodothermales bacterium]|nr:FAD-linked oxidase C-terminal domain-containing protein [Rhodothermales bacterium]
AHASAGCLHVRPFLDTKQARDVGLLREIAEGSAALVREYGGTLASEHGDGLARSSLAPSFYGAPLYAAYVATKRAFDPQGLLNPGKVVEAPPLDHHLRLSPTEHPRPHAAPLAFRTADGRDLGLAGAVEACNGQAVCRQRGTGAMCPSFMATREEKDSTRGRADALREALAGHFLLRGPEVAEAMDLCLSCKACVSECPSSVDVAAMKAVWLHERWKGERPPLRTRLLAHLPTLARRGAGAMAPLLNRLARLGPAFFGLDSTRTLPALARRPFLDDAWPAPTDPDVVVFADTFARFFEPDVLHAARRVMEAAGVRAAVAPYACCGRTLISEGFLDAARTRARRVVDVLAPHAAAGRPIVGLEPSCLLTLRDEVPRLLSDDPRAALVARHARTFDEWALFGLERLGSLETPEAGSPETFVHTHCHQRALVGAGAAVAALAAGGVAARESGAGCCGLAGGWGYEAGHAAVSRAIAEDRLAPAVRALAPEATVVAAGFSCRSQIAHTTGRTAVHPAIALAARLRG